MKAALSLIAVGLLSRLLPHPPNAVALGAVALYAGARLPRRWAVAVPLLILLGSDALLDTWNGYPFDLASRSATYLTFAAIALVSSAVQGRVGVAGRAGMSVAASTAFYVVSNFAVWAEGSGWSMPATFDGLIACYTVALPFYSNSLAADLIGTGVLFGLDAAFAWFGRRIETPVEAATS
ncbi:MAG: DUF6580 family putative transport protein [Isosphaeraceae bacterium]